MLIPMVWKERNKPARWLAKAKGRVIYNDGSPLDALNGLGIVPAYQAP
jgi:hypothetical protein